MIRLTPEQFLNRVVVKVATATGQRVEDVLNGSLAVALWTWWELQQIEDEARVQRLGERVDLASMIGMAFNDPKKLQEQERRYLKAAGLLQPMMQKAKALALDTVAKVKARRAGG